MLWLQCCPHTCPLHTGCTQENRLSVCKCLHCTLSTRRRLVPCILPRTYSWSGHYCHWERLSSPCTRSTMSRPLPLLRCRSNSPRKTSRRWNRLSFCKCLQRTLSTRRRLVPCIQGCTGSCWRLCFCWERLSSPGTPSNSRCPARTYTCSPDTRRKGPREVHSTPGCTYS